MPSPSPTLPTILKRGACLRCPNCGQGKIFARYLKPVEKCAVCQEPLGHIRADDAPPWLTIFIVAHILVPIVSHIEAETPWPLAVSMIVWPSIALVLTLAILPFAKSLFIGIIWKYCPPRLPKPPAA